MEMEEAGQRSVGHCTLHTAHYTTGLAVAPPCSVYAMSVSRKP
jgi:hypothetical protein